MRAIEAKLLHDPWSLTRGERSALCAAHAHAQLTWLPRLRRLVEPPLPDERFPAFLLDQPAFARLARAVAAASDGTALDVATADELQHFVDHYQGWLQRDAHVTLAL